MKNTDMDDIGHTALILADKATEILELNLAENSELFDRLYDLLENFCKPDDYRNYN